MNSGAAGGATERVLGPGEVTVELFTFREGLLAAAGHDLRLRATAFELWLDLEAAAVRARFDAAALEVVCARRGERDDPGALSPSDKAQILSTVRRDVLRTDRYPEIRFDSERIDPARRTVEGRLTLCGVERPLSFHFREEQERWVAELPLDQRLFGLKPFVGLFGTLRLKPVLRVRISLPGSVAALAGRLGLSGPPSPGSGSGGPRGR